MTDVTQAIAPKSDQMNADDLLQPRTIRITSVDVQATPEQPITIRFEGDNGRPWKPCKTAARCLATIWGTNSAQWIGLRCTIYNDPTVTWAGAAVGGIRVSHMEGLDKPRTLQLTKTRGKKGAVTIQPLLMAYAPPPPDPTKPAQDAARAAAAKGKAAFTEWWKANKDCHALVTDIMDDLKALTAKADAPPAQEADDDEPPL
jgi:hypothetical protein